MYKAVVMFYDITDIKEFERIFFEDIYPHLMKLPGIVRLDLSSIKPMDIDLKEDVHRVQLIADVIYENQDAMDRIIHSTEGRRVNELATQINAKMYIFFGKEKSYYPPSSDKRLDSYF